MATQNLHIMAYERQPALCRPWDPRAVEVASIIAEALLAQMPSLQVEHVGSTAVAPDRWLPKPNCGPIGRQYTPTGPGAPPVRDSLAPLGRTGARLRAKALEAVATCGRQQ